MSAIDFTCDDGSTVSAWRLDNGSAIVTIGNDGEEMAATLTDTQTRLVAETLAGGAHLVTDEDWRAIVEAAESVDRAGGVDHIAWTVQRANALRRFRAAAERAGLPLLA